MRIFQKYNETNRRILNKKRFIKLCYYTSKNYISSNQFSFKNNISKTVRNTYKNEYSNGLGDRDVDDNRDDSDNMMVKVVILAVEITMAMVMM